MAAAIPMTPKDRRRAGVTSGATMELYYRTATEAATTDKPRDRALTEPNLCYSFL